jgi:hypothetical protein
MKRLAVKIGEYEKDGQTKGRYQNIGVIMQNDNGEFLLLDPTVSLAGCLTAQNMMNHRAGRKTGDRLMVSVFEENNQGQQRNDGGGYGSQQSQPPRDLDSDAIPF